MEFSNCDVHLWRMIIAVSWSVLLQFVLFSTYITVININLQQFNVLAIPFRCILSVKCLYFLPLAAVVFLQGVVWSKDYRRAPDSHFIGKRFLLFINLFSYQNFIALCLHVALGVTIVAVYGSVTNGDFSSFSTKCTILNNNYTDDICLNEKKLFFILSGIWMGVYTFLKEYTFNTKRLTFPVIQQFKFVRIMTAFVPCLKRSIINSLLPSVLFCACYYFKGNLPRSYFSSLSGLTLPDNLLDNFLVLLNVQLISYLWMFTAIYLFTLDVMTILFNILLTERAFFPLTTFMYSSSNIDVLLMQDALSSEKVPIIQHLGFFDLAQLSQFDSQRRAELFMLSQPGGHPHSWNAIVGECFKVIDKFTQELNKYIEDSHLKKVTKTEKPVPSIVNTSMYSPHQRSYNIRNLSIKPNAECLEQSPTIALQKSYERFLKVYHDWFRSKFDAFCKKPIIVYFFGEMTEPKIKHLLFQSQPVIWAVESLSFLTCFSIKEDSFGVAQRDLSKIIVLLLHLKNSLDKLQKQNVFITKSNKLDLVDIQMRNSLKFSVKQSIYRISITFRDFIHDMNLSPDEYVVQMLNFVEFKEV